MIDDIRMRKLAPKTQQQYVRAAGRFREFKRPADTANRDDLRRYQLYLVDQGTLPMSRAGTKRNHFVSRWHAGPVWQVAPVSDDAIQPRTAAFMRFMM